MELRTVIPAIGLGGPAGAPRPGVASVSATARLSAPMGTCGDWRMRDGKQRAIRVFATAPYVPNHPARRLEEASP